MGLLIDDNTKYLADEQFQEIKDRYNILRKEADMIRESDRQMITGILQNFYNRRLEVGVGFKRAYGAILSGDYFELFKLNDETYFFVFADICGHGLPAYITLIRLRNAITLSIKDIQTKGIGSDLEKQTLLLTKIGNRFADLLAWANSTDFASVLFTFITNDQDKFNLRFYNRGHYFPVIVRKYQNKPLGLYNLNINFEEWVPQKGHLLGEDIRFILGEKYDQYPSCDFMLYEGDSILYFSDGIIEAKNENTNSAMFGIKKIEQMLLNLLNRQNMTSQAIIDKMFSDVEKHLGDQRHQSDDMTAVLITLPMVRD